MRTEVKRDSTNSARLFYALWPDDAVRMELLNLQTSMQGRMTRYENLHLTMVFLGEQPTSLLPILRDVLKQMPRPDFQLDLDCLGYFSRPRIAWAGMHAVPDALSSLHKKLTDELEFHCITSASGERFKPHVTLARDTSAPAELEFAPIRWRARHLVLVSSTVLADGIHYRIVASR